MKAYIYKAALYCHRCGQEICSRLDKELKTPANVTDETTYDSDDYPKGPYANGGGAADTPQHCDDCGAFLDNPLTSDGIHYTVSALKQYRVTGEGSALSMDAWANHLMKLGIYLTSSQLEELGAYNELRKKERAS